MNDGRSIRTTDGRSTKTDGRSATADGRSTTTEGSKRTNNDSSTLPITGRSMSTASSWATTSSRDNTSTEGLFFTSLNSLAPTTIVMLHVLLSSHLEWAHCWPKLTEYHLLLPDLPQHSRSKHAGPFSFVVAADLVADMIRAHAHDGRAHVVGLSTGGFITLELIRRHPDVVLSAFVSGATPVNDFWKVVNSSPKITFLGLSAMLYSPRSLLLKATGWAPEFQNNELLKEVKQNITSRLYTAGCRETANWTAEDMAAVGKKDKRIALVAGGKQDNVEGMREMGRIMQAMGVNEGKETRVFVVREAIHAWNLQNPLLFAKGVREWIEKGQMPANFEMLE
ncbi:alpha/beta-hydrolase [Hypoxylon fragiforme]|uniref:alpha/beta-hydrolase n=1 Tax=Hypoxylon fragiforme TaxID=63214 RepID=UPI0020C6A6E2|nr:alpha/beta-hydrolase [Hypoxylon fragiforme]KAI2603110.1 alpha/beta-hydrolase [Hypoxylon fragiforme]